MTCRNLFRTISPLTQMEYKKGIDAKLCATLMIHSWLCNKICVELSNMRVITPSMANMLHSGPARRLMPKDVFWALEWNFTRKRIFERRSRDNRSIFLKKEKNTTNLIVFDLKSFRSSVHSIFFDLLFLNRRKLSC